MMAAVTTLYLPVRDPILTGNCFVIFINYYDLYTMQFNICKVKMWYKNWPLIFLGRQFAYPLWKSISWLKSSIYRLSSCFPRLSISNSLGVTHWETTRGHSKHTLLRKHSRVLLVCSVKLSEEKKGKTFFHQ